MSNVIMIAVAVVCATVAALLSRAWLVSQSARAPAEVASVETPSKSIVVAIKDLKYGDKITAEAIKVVPWGDNVLPRGAYTSTDSMLKGGSRVVLRDMSQGEPVLAHKLLGGESDNTLPGKLSRNMKAVTIRVNEVAGVAGFVQPEDRVDVFMTYGGDKKTEAGGAAGSAIVVLLQNIRVLAVDQATKRVDQPTPASAVTLEVTTKDAQKLTLAGMGGNLSLALNRLDNGISTENVGTIIFDDLLNNGQVSTGTPAGRSGPVVTVTRSVERKNYNVLKDNRSDEDWQHEILSHQGNNTAPSQ
jgi:pilus assembly protein CpaB